MKVIFFGFQWNILTGIGQIFIHYWLSQSSDLSHWQFLLWSMVKGTITVNTIRTVVRHVHSMCACINLCICLEKGTNSQYWLYFYTGLIKFIKLPISCWKQMLLFMKQKEVKSGKSGKIWFIFKNNSAGQTATNNWKIGTLQLKSIWPWSSTQTKVYECAVIKLSFSNDRKWNDQIKYSRK